MPGGILGWEPLLSLGGPRALAAISNPWGRLGPASRKPPSAIFRERIASLCDRDGVSRLHGCIRRNFSFQKHPGLLETVKEWACGRCLAGDASRSSQLLPAFVKQHTTRPRAVQRVHRARHALYNAVSRAPFRVVTAKIARFEVSRVCFAKS